MAQAKKGISRQHVFLWLALFGLTLWLIITTIVLITRGQNPQSQAASEFSFTESFATDTYKDATATDADWDTADELLELPTADGSMYEADRSTPGSTQFTSSSLDYALSADNNPHLAGGIAATAHLGYAVWSETAGDWIGSDGSSGMEDLSVEFGGADETENVQSVAIDVTSTGQPYVCWEGVFIDTSRGLFCTYYDPGQTAWVDATGSPGYSTVETVAIGGGFAFLDMQLDSLDRPNVLYGRTDINDLSFERWNGSVFVDIGSSPNVSGTGTFGTVSTTPISKVEVELDAVDNPHIIYEDTVGGNQEVLYLVGDIGGDDWEDVTGAPYSAACLATTCAAANVSNDVGTSRSPSLALDSAGDPHIVFSDNTGLARFEVFYGQRVGSAWVGADGVTPGFVQITTSPVFGGSNPGSNNPTLGLDGDLPIVAMVVKTAAFGRTILGQRYNSDLDAWVEFDRTTPGQTRIYDVNALSGNPQNNPPSLIVDSFGNAATAWLQTNLATAFFARWLDPVVNAQAQSVPVDSVSPNIVSVTFVPTFEVDGTATTFFASNDGGANFAEVQPSVEYFFTTAGSDLEWRAEMTGDAGDVSFTPQLDELELIYTIASTPVDDIDRIDGDDPTEQSINVSHERFPSPDSAELGFVARDELLVDTFTAAPLVSKTGGTILLNNPQTLEPEVLTELERVLPDGAPVIIAGGTSAISGAVEQSLVEAGFAVTRIGGVNRRATAADLARELVVRNGGATSKCFLTEEDALVDALGTDAIAGNLEDGFADCILLTARGNDALDEFTRAYIAGQTDLQELQVIGGQVAVPTPVEETLKSSFPSLAVSRIAGANRFATNVATIEAYFTDPTYLTVASGSKEAIPGATSAGGVGSVSALYFDALLAGPFAAQNESPLVIVATNTLPPETAAYLESVASSVNHMTIIGSLAEVSQVVEDAIRDSLE